MPSFWMFCDVMGVENLKYKKKKGKKYTTWPADDESVNAIWMCLIQNHI